jgi:hypothetical protein
MIFSSVVYFLCTITSTLCAVLLYLSYQKTGARFLFWSAICFLCLALNNLLIFVDLILTPSIDLSVMRIIPAVIGFALFLWSCVWETL